MKYFFNLTAAFLLLAMLASCKSGFDQNAISLKIANENLKIAEAAPDAQDQEKYYMQALTGFYKYTSLADNSEARGDAKFDIESDDDESVIEAKIKGKKCISILKEKFGKTCKFSDSPR